MWQCNDYKGHVVQLPKEHGRQTVLLARYVCFGKALVKENSLEQGR